MSVIAAGTWVHCRHKHKAAWICNRTRRSRNSHLLVFKRLTEYLKGTPVKFRKLVKKQQTVVSKRYFPRTGYCSAACKSRRRNGVVGTSERTLCHKRGFLVNYAADGVDVGGLDRFLKGHGGKYCCQPLCKHGFSRPGAAYHKDVVSPCGGVLQSLFGGVLTLYLGKIYYVKAVFLLYFIRSLRKYHRFPAEMLHYIRGIFNAVHGDTVHNACFIGVVGRDKNAFKALFFGKHHHWQYAVYGAHVAVKRDLPDKRGLGNILVYLTSHAEQSHKYCKVVDASRLFCVRGGKVHYDLCKRERCPNGTQGGAYPFSAFLYNGVRKPYYFKRGSASACFYLNVHGKRVKSEQAEASDLCKHKFDPLSFSASEFFGLTRRYRSVLWGNRLHRL